MYVVYSRLILAHVYVQSMCFTLSVVVCVLSNQCNFFAQVRPLLELERLKSSEECVRLVSEDQLVLGNDRSFRFDYIFPHDTTQVWGQAHLHNITSSNALLLGPSPLSLLFSLPLSLPPPPLSLSSRRSTSPVSPPSSPPVLMATTRPSWPMVRLALVNRSLLAVRQPLMDIS